MSKWERSKKIMHNLEPTLVNRTAAATVNWEELKDPEVTTTKDDLIKLSTYVLEQASK